MDIEFKLPDLGENIESGDVVSLLVREGDVINPDQPVVELETDKATVEVPCPIGGRVVKIHIHQGDTVPIGAPLLSIQQADDAAEPPSPEPPESPSSARETAGPAAGSLATAAEPQGASPVEAAPPLVPPSEPASTLGTREIPPAAAVASPEAARSVTSMGRRIAAAASPATRRLARELGVELAGFQGSGPGGRITEQDVMAAVRGEATAPTRQPAARPDAPSATPTAPSTVSEAEDAYGPVLRERMTKIRQTIARNMAHSASTIPHVTNFDDADITELDKIRRESVSDYIGANIKLTMMPFLMKAVSHALRAHAKLNASLDLEANEIIYKQYVNVGVAVDTDRGLIVPVVRHVDHLTIPQIASALSTVAEQARSGQFKLDDLRGGTFTISNLGAIGGAYSTPIINHPEVALLLVGRSRRLPVVVDDRIEPRLMMPLSLSYDHRLVDGATAARFLNEIISYLEAPGRLLLAP